MLGKAIKNEFRNREHTVLVVLALFLAGAIFIRTFNNSEKNESLLIALLVVFVYLGIYISGFVVAFISPIKDFRDRLFKDQGYLTHTLPMNIPTLIGARLIVDLAIMIQLMVAGFIANFLAIKDNDLLDSFIDILKLLKYDTDRGKVIHYFILISILVAVSYLSFIWLFCAAYTVGHSLFNKNKKLISGVAVLIMAFINFCIFKKVLSGYILGEINIESEDALLYLFMGIASVLLLIYVLIVGIVFKKKLNLE